MPRHEKTRTYSNIHKTPNRILRWLGDDSNRNDKLERPLKRMPNESSYQYFSRWLRSRGLELEWEKDVNPEAPVDRCTLWRPRLNGYDLPACGVGIGAGDMDADRAKEDACEALIKTYRCFQRR